MPMTRWSVYIHPRRNTYERKCKVAFSLNSLGVIITSFSDIYASDSKGESIIVHMEHPTEKGFDIAEFLLPSFTCTKLSGFSEDEQLQLEKFVRNNAPLIWEIAREDGEIIADVG